MHATLEKEQTKKARIIWKKKFTKKIDRKKICTPRLRERADQEGENNLKKEIKAALDIQSEEPKFIIPLIFEGDRLTSVPSKFPSIFYPPPLLFFIQISYFPV